MARQTGFEPVTFGFVDRTMTALRTTETRRSRLAGTAPAPSPAPCESHSPCIVRRMNLSCPHCGFRGPIDEKGLYPLERGVCENELFSYEWGRFVSVYLCPQCDRVTIWRYVWADHTPEERSETLRLYPVERDNAELPDTVAHRLSEAETARGGDPGVYGVAVRKLLEAICNDQGGTGRDLYARVENLSERRLLPEQLAESFHVMRKLAVFGAHDRDSAIQEGDLPLIEGLADLIVDYLYRAPQRVRLLNARLEELDQPRESSEG